MTFFHPELQVRRHMYINMSESKRQGLFNTCTITTDRSCLVMRRGELNNSQVIWSSNVIAILGKYCPVGKHSASWNLGTLQLQDTLPVYELTRERRLNLPEIYKGSFCSDIWGAPDLLPGAVTWLVTWFSFQRVVVTRAHGKFLGWSPVLCRSEYPSK